MSIGDIYSRRPNPIHTRVDSATYERLSEYGNAARLSLFNAAYELIIAGLDAREAQRNNGEVSARGKLTRLQRQHEDSEQLLTTLAQQSAQLTEGELESMCEEFGVKPQDVWTFAQRAGTKTEQRTRVKDHERCRMYVRGLLAAKEGGLDIAIIRDWAAVEGFTYWQVIAVLHEFARNDRKGKTGSFWRMSRD